MPLCSSNPRGVEEEEDEKGDQPADTSWRRTCEMKVGGERKKEKGEGKQKRDRKQKRRERLGSVRLLRRRHVFVCVRPLHAAI